MAPLETRNVNDFLRTIGAPQPKRIAATNDLMVRKSRQQRRTSLRNLEHFADPEQQPRHQRPFPKLCAHRNPIVALRSPGLDQLR